MAGFWGWIATVLNPFGGALNGGNITSEGHEQTAIQLEEEKKRQGRKGAPPTTQAIPTTKPTTTPTPPPVTLPVTPTEEDDDLEVVSKPLPVKPASIPAPAPPPPQKPIWEDPPGAVQRWLFPLYGTAHIVYLGNLLRVNWLAGTHTQCQWEYQTELADYENQGKLSYSNFLAWLARRTGAYNGDYGDQGGQADQFWDQSACLWFQNLGQMDGQKGFIHGIEPLAQIFGESYLRALNAYCGGVRGALYESVQIEKIKANWPRAVDNNLGSLDSHAGEGLAYGLAVNLQATQNLDSLPRIILDNSHLSEDKSNFPIRLPVSLLIEDEDLAEMSEEEIKNIAYTSVNSLPEFMLWFVRVFDEVLGKFPLTFEIGESDMLSLEEEMKQWEKSQGAESDPNLPFYLKNDKLVSFSMKDGRRVKRIKVPNVAEALAELSGLGLVNDQQTALSHEFLMRILQESGSTKQTAIQTYYMADALIDWLGFSTKEVAQEVNFSWKPNLDEEETALNIRELLTPSAVPINVLWENEKDNFQRIINIIIEAHAIVKSAHTEGLGADPSTLKNRILKFAEGFEPDPQVRKETQPGEVIDESITTEFDEFCDRVESGFTDAPYISDPENPYGRPYDQRPKIKRVDGNLVE